MIRITDKSGIVRLSLSSIGTGSKAYFTLMKEDYIILKFSLANPVYFQLGDTVDLSGLMPEPLGGIIGKSYELADLCTPTYNTSNGGYDYELRLDAYYWKWKNKKFKYMPESAGQESTWSLTASLDVHMGVFLRNLKAIGYRFGRVDFGFSIDSTVEKSSKAISYDNMNLIDALTRMAETWECEWWVTENIIHFGRCEYGDPVRIEMGVEASAMSRNESKGTFATRIYAFGSTRNIPANYRPVDESVVVNGVVQRRLMLPADIPYIDAYPDMSTEQAVEDIVVFDDVYPRRTGTLSNVHTKEYTDKTENEDGTTTYTKWNAYRFRDTGITFSKDYLIQGQEL